jgi:hypothetical protein
MTDSTEATNKFQTEHSSEMWLLNHILERLLKVETALGLYPPKLEDEQPPS